ncbi:hypothetical protein JTE90_020103 [Oedothorax gibbosus]|uniref:Uncharacterized protein n=1 Tax=Oedothorax gibbosus TaxID=931172 RepID=A0AAV6VP00_9ARAC|nr:hypothetical protein JTE90_020103 [Oedothorax gibbosus]
MTTSIQLCIHNGEEVKKRKTPKEHSTALNLETPIFSKTALLTGCSIPLSTRVICEPSLLREIFYFNITVRTERFLVAVSIYPLRPTLQRVGPPTSLFTSHYLMESEVGRRSHKRQGGGGRFKMGAMTLDHKTKSSITRLPFEGERG